MRTMLLLGLILVAAGHCEAAFAQTAEPKQTPASVLPPQEEIDRSDFSITANVTGRELRFEVVPNPKVEFYGTPERKTVFEDERTNLPRPVQPGVTYRDIGVRLVITSIFPDIDRIVAEALGEVPVSDNTVQPNKPEPVVNTGVSQTTVAAHQENRVSNGSKKSLSMNNRARQSARRRR